MFTEEWKKYHARKCKKCTPCQGCQKCGKLKPRKAFHLEQWNLPDHKGICVECDVKECTKCHLLKKRPSFPVDQWVGKSDSCVSNDVRLCRMCDRRKCGICGKDKVKQEFDKNNWSSKKCQANEAVAASRRVKINELKK